MHMEHPTTTPKNAEQSSEQPPVTTVYSVVDFSDSYHPVTMGKFTDYSSALRVKQELPEKLPYTVDLRIRETDLYPSAEAYYADSDQIE